MRGSLKFCISGFTQKAHHLSSEVTPTIFSCLLSLLLVVLCVVFALNCLCITCSIATWWLKSKICVLLEVEKKVALASTPSLSEDQLLLDSPHYFCARGCVFFVRRRVNHIEVGYDGR